jgi:hypothetical protein
LAARPYLATAPIGKGEQGAEAVFIPHTLQHWPAAFTDLVTTTAVVAAATATVAAAAFACGGCRCPEGGAHGAGELSEERVLP